MRKERGYTVKNTKYSKLDLRLKRYRLRGKNRCFFEAYYKLIKQINNNNDDNN